jgi:hypothetical protein
MINMKTSNKLKNFTIIILAMSIGIICIMFLNGIISTHDSAIAKQTYQTVLKKVDLSEVDMWKDKANIAHYKLERMRVTQEAMQANMDSMSSALMIKSKQIQALTNIKTELEIEKPLETVAKTDSATGKKWTEFSWSDDWMQVTGKIGQTGDSIYISGHDEIVKTDYWKRKWFLGQKRYYSDFTNKNPHIKISGLRQIETTQKSKTFSVGPAAGLGINSSGQIVPSVSISVQWSWFKF